MLDYKYMGKTGKERRKGRPLGTHADHFGSPPASFPAVRPSQLCDTGGPQQVAWALEPEGSGLEAIAPAASQIRLGRGQRPGHTHPG